MANPNSSIDLLLPEEIIMNRIYYIRGQKVMMDSDLAELYQVETKRLKEQVKRNAEKFPLKYMFELTSEEFNFLRSQIATSKNGRGGTRYLPMVFTEHGILQLSNVLSSDRATKVSFIIIDVFVKLREMFTDNLEIRQMIEKLQKTVGNNSKNIELVFQYIDELIDKKEDPEPRKLIGFKISKTLP